MLMTQKELETIIKLIREEVAKELDRREEASKPKRRPAKKVTEDERG